MLVPIALLANTLPKSPLIHVLIVLRASTQISSQRNVPLVRQASIREALAPRHAMWPVLVLMFRKLAPLLLLSVHQDSARRMRGRPTAQRASLVLSPVTRVKSAARIVSQADTQRSIERHCARSARRASMLAKARLYVSPVWLASLLWPGDLSAIPAETDSINLKRRAIRVSPVQLARSLYPMPRSVMVFPVPSAALPAWRACTHPV